jgi:hypothetical protein
MDALPDGGFIVYDATRTEAGDIAVVRRVRPDGIIVAAAGIGLAGSTGDSGSALAARISAHASVAGLPNGGFLVSEADTNRIRLVSSSGGITTVAGTGAKGFGGDGGPATQAQLSSPSSAAALTDGGFAIADSGNGRIRRVLSDGTISTLAVIDVEGIKAVAQGGVIAWNRNELFLVSSSGVVSSRIRLHPGLLVEAALLREDGSFLAAVTTAPTYSGSIRSGVFRVNRDGRTTLFAGKQSDTCAFPGPNHPATQTTLSAVDLAPDSGGAVLVLDFQSNRVRRVGQNGLMSTVAGGAGSKSDGLCGRGAGEIGMYAWNAFEIVRARATRQGVAVRIATTLPARVILQLRRGRRTVARRTTHVKAGYTVLRIRQRLAPGRYAISIDGRGKGGHQAPPPTRVRVS